MKKTLKLLVMGLILAFAMAPVNTPATTESTAAITVESQRGSPPAIAESVMTSISRITTDVGNMEATATAVRQTIATDVNYVAAANPANTNTAANSLNNNSNDANGTAPLIVAVVNFSNFTNDANTGSAASVINGQIRPPLIVNEAEVSIENDSPANTANNMAATVTTMDRETTDANLAYTVAITFTNA